MLYVFSVSPCILLPQRLGCAGGSAEAPAVRRRRRRFGGGAGGSAEAPVALRVRRQIGGSRCGGTGSSARVPTSLHSKDTGNLARAPARHSGAEATSAGITPLWVAQATRASVTQHIITSYLDKQLSLLNLFYALRRAVPVGTRRYRCAECPPY